MQKDKVSGNDNGEIQHAVSKSELIEALGAQEQIDTLIDALQVLMAWQVKNVKKWHNPAYDYAAEALQRVGASASP